MRKVAASLVCLAFASSVATAGTVSFGGSPQEIVLGSGTPAVFDVSISSADLASFDSVSLLIGTHDSLVLNWAYDQSFLDRLSGAATPPGAFGVYPVDLNVGGSDFSPAIFSAPLLIGRLTIPTDGLAEGTYEVMVSSATEMEMLDFSLSLAAAGFTQEGLEGVGTINVRIPEPATLVMLGLGGVAAVIRRRK